MSSRYGLHLKSQFILISLYAALLFSVASLGCSSSSQGGPATKANDELVFTKIPHGWKKERSRKAQAFYIQKDGALFYANSYCDYYGNGFAKADFELDDYSIKEVNSHLKELSLAHIKKLGDVHIVKRESFPLNPEEPAKSLSGIFSTARSKYQDQVVLIFHFGAVLDDCYYDMNGISVPGKSDADLEKDFKQFVRGARV